MNPDELQNEQQQNLTDPSNIQTEVTNNTPPALAPNAAPVQSVTEQMTFQALQESERARIRLEQRIAQMETQQQQANRLDPDALNDEFQRNPASVTAQLMRQENQQSAQQMQEIYAFVQQQKQQTAYQNLKGSFRSRPHWNVVEPYIDQLMQSVSPITVQTIEWAYYMVVGQLTSNGQLNPTPTPPPPARPPMPPQINPSAPNVPTPANRNTVQLTELQKRLAREYRMTDEEYAQWLHADNSAVVTMNKPGAN
jgi:hypothetical protein